MVITGLLVAVGPAPAELIDVTVPGDQIVATSNNSPGSEGVANAIDNAPTKYMNFDKLNTGFTVTPQRRNTIVVGLSLMSANDAPDRDPASYRLEGSNDGINFTAISSGNVPAFPARFYKIQILFPEHTNSYNTYRLIFPTVVDPTTAVAMQIGEVELLGDVVTEILPCPNGSPPLLRQGPVDTPVLLGARATFRVALTGPWRLQWYRNGAEIPGATSYTYTTPAVSNADDGALYRVRATTSSCYQDSDEAMLSIFTPSTTESIALNWVGQRTWMRPDDITGLHAQAYWNNLSQRSGTLPQPLNSSNRAHASITVQWDTSGEWGVGTGDEDAAGRMFDGMCTSFGTNEQTAQTVTFSGVPPGNHSLLLYTVQIPLEFFSMDFQAVTFLVDGATKTAQQRFIRPQNGDEYNASPGFLLVTSDRAATRGVGNTIRFDNLEPEDGRIQIRFFSPDRTQPPPPADPIRGPGVNGLQLLLNPARGWTRLGRVTSSGGAVSVLFATTRGFTYTVEHTADFIEWIPLPPSVLGTGSPVTVFDSSPEPSRRFYRVRVE